MKIVISTLLLVGFLSFLALRELKKQTEKTAKEVAAITQKNHVKRFKVNRNASEESRICSLSERP